MVKVHIWLKQDNNVGHTALTVGNEYISFWPETSAGSAKDLKMKTSQPGSFIESLKEDIFSEGNRQPITVELKGLDEKQILQYIDRLKRVKPRYQLMKNNCSHVVVGALMAGTQQKPGFTPHAGDYARLGHLARGVWTPPQVLRFVNELRRV